MKNRYKIPILEYHGSDDFDFDILDYNIIYNIHFIYKFTSYICNIDITRNKGDKYYGIRIEKHEKK